MHFDTIRPLRKLGPSKLWRPVATVAGQLTLIGWAVLRAIAAVAADAVVAALSDDVLVARCIERGRRDERPFQELYRRYQPTVWRACYGMMRNSDDADDLTQETFFKAYRSLNNFEGRSSFKTWIYHIAVNTCRNKLREQSRRPRSHEDDLSEMVEMLPGGISVEKQVIERAGTNMLAQAMALLQPDELKILQMKYMEKRPYTEIAETLNIGISAAKMRVQRARLSLQNSYRTLESET